MSKEAAKSFWDFPNTSAAVAVSSFVALTPLELLKEHNPVFEEMAYALETIGAVALAGFLLGLLLPDKKKAN